MMSFQRMKSEILADKKKTSILSGLLVVVLILGARAVLSGGGATPSRASAATASAAASVGGSSDPGAHADPESRVRELISRWRDSAHTSQPERDLFALSEEHFPHPSKPELTTTEGAKSAEQTDDETLRRQAITQALQAITLKSTLVGKTPVAVVSIPSLTGRRDVMLRIGDAIDGFSVVRIEQGRVVLEREGSQAELVVISPLD